MSVPETCPGCGRVLFPSYLHRPQPKWQPRARALFLIGAVISGPLMLASLLLTGYVLTVLNPKREIGKGGDVGLGIAGWVVGAALALVPGLALGAWAYRIRRTVRLDCKECGWGETFYLSAGRYGRAARPDPGEVE